MAYILIVNPSMLHNFGQTGIPYDDALSPPPSLPLAVVMGLWASFALAQEWV